MKEEESPQLPEAVVVELENKVLVAGGDPQHGIADLDSSHDTSKSSSVSEFDNNSVDDFVLETLLGSGGMGEVYRASRKGMDGKFAIKVLKSNLLSDDGCRKRFEQEAQACSMLTSPNLVSVLGFGVADQSKPYIVMEYIDGESLADFLAREKHLESHDFISVFMQVCDALIHSHSKQVIHRDLKPSNIMLKPLASGGFLVKIVDFGIARLLPKAETLEQKLTQTGELLGSPVYMSPEQCTGQPMDPRSDIYSLGCVMYEALTGAPPFLGDNVVKTILMHLNESPGKFEDKLAQNTISPDLEEIIVKCLEKRPADRFQTVQQIKEALEGADTNTSEARKLLIRRKQHRTKLQKQLIRIESKFQITITTLLATVLLLSVWFVKNNQEIEYQKAVDAAELANDHLAVEHWRKAIQLAEALAKPEKVIAGLHSRLAGNLVNSHNPYLGLSPKKTAAEREYDKAIKIYERRSDSFSPLLTVLDSVAAHLKTFGWQSFTGSQISLFNSLLQTPSYYDPDETDQTSNWHTPRFFHRNGKAMAETDRLRLSAERAFARSDFAEAAKLYEKCLNDCDHDKLALCYQKLAQQCTSSKEALAFLEKAIVVEPETELRFSLFEDLDYAIRAIHLNPRSFGDRMLLADEAAKRHELKSAVLESTIALSISNDETARKKLLGWKKTIDAATPNPSLTAAERAIPYYLKLVDISSKVNSFDPRNNYYNECLSCCYVAVSDYEKGLTTLEKVHYDDHYKLESYRRLAELSLRCGDISKTILYYGKILKELTPQTYNITAGYIHLDIAYVYELSGEYAKARKEIDAAYKELSKGAVDAFDSTAATGNTTSDVSIDL